MGVAPRTGPARAPRVVEATKAIPLPRAPSTSMAPAAPQSHSERGSPHRPKGRTKAMATNCARSSTGRLP